MPKRLRRSGGTAVRRTAVALAAAAVLLSGAASAHTVQPADATGNRTSASAIARGAFPGVRANASSRPKAHAIAERIASRSRPRSTRTVQVAAAVSTRSISIPPEADAEVTAAAASANFGTSVYADVYGGHNPRCVSPTDTSYALMRFNLSAIPAGATITHVELDTMTRAGYAQNGDPNHWALFVSDDSWGETTVNWNNRPSDGTATVGTGGLPGGGDIRNSSLALGGAPAALGRAACNGDGTPVVDPNPPDDRPAVFPSTTDGGTPPVVLHETDFISHVTTERAGDGKLSLELWTTNCDTCNSGYGTNLSYWARYYTREASNTAFRPKLVVTYATPPVAANVTLTGPAATTAGAGTVKLDDVPASALLQAGASSAKGTAINDVAINDVAINDVGFANLAATEPALGNVTLNSIPLLRAGGWTAALSGTPLAGLPLQNVTLRDYYALPDSVNPEKRSTNPIPSITLADLDLSHSPLGSLPASAFLLGNVPLSAMRSLSVWCQLFGTVYCPNQTALANKTVLAAALEGAPINDVPINDVAINDVAINDVLINDLAINDVPLDDLAINDVAINDVAINDVLLPPTAINDVAINDVAINDVMLHNAGLTGSAINDVPIGALPIQNDVIVCASGQPGPGSVDCTTATLGQAYAAGAIRPGVTLGDLRRALPEAAFAGVKLGDLHFYGNVTLRGLVDSLPDNTVTLGEYFLLVLRSPSAQQGLAWEQLDLAGSNLPAIASGSPSPTVPYQASFDVQPGPLNASGPATINVDATLPAGFLYVAGSTRVVAKPGPCGSSGSTGDPSTTSLPSGRQELTWNVPTVVGTGYLLCFDARPGLTLGPQAAGLDATPDGGATATAQPANVTVGDTFEANDSVAAATPITTDEFLLSYLTSARDVDYYKFDPTTTIPAGSRVTVHLSHLPADYDLVVYGPGTPDLRPDSSVPLDGAPLTDTGVELTHATDSLPSQTLDDLNLQPGLPLVGVSASRGTDPEDVVFTYDGKGPYTIQVTGYNGATSDEPYMLRVQTTPPRVASTVPSFTAGTTAGPALGSLPAGLNTVFLVNQEQLVGRYGSTAAASVITALQNNLAAFANLGFPSTIFFVDSVSAVRSAYVNWNAHPGDPTLANAVVGAINAAVDSQIRQAPGGAGLKYLVLVGDDRIIPFARLGDFTVAANEAGYASTFGQNTDLFSSLNLGDFLSDDPYGDVNPIPYLDRQLYVPELAVGRLVETPTQIVGALNRFVQFNGRLDPQTSLTTGYDFLSDGAQKVKSAFDARLSTGSQGLISDTWDCNQLLQGLLPTAGMPSLVSLNGHADHYRFQPPASTACSGGASGLYTTAALAASAAPRANRLVFSMGCHAGLSVDDATVTAPSVSTLDWPQAYMGWGTGSTPDANAQGLGVGAYLGNTGYGYGDTLVVAYSEELNGLFAQRIAAGSSVGSALADAKQTYFAGRGVFGVYDEKAMSEFTLYGLPMWSVAGPARAAAPAATGARALGSPAAAAAANPVVTDPATGLDAETFDLNGIVNTPQTSSGSGTYWSGPDGVQVSQFRPVQPKAYVALSGATAHGALITALSSQDQGGVDPVYARPTVDLSSHEPELSFGDVAFPSRIQALRTYQTPTGRAQQIVLVTGQFFRTGPPDANGTGVQRLFTHIGGRALRSSSTDYTPPAFDQIDATQVGGSAAFAVRVTDATPSGAGTVKRVLVGVRSGSASDWTFADLAQSASDPARWTGSVPISGTQFEYFVQAVDAAGNVAVSTNKGFYFTAEPPQTSSGDLHVTTTSPAPPSGWFDGSADVAVTVGTAAPAAGSVTVSLDGGAPQPYTGTLHVTADGLHTVTAQSSSGSATTTFAVDASPPTVDITTPANGAVFARSQPASAAFACNDAGIGVQSCVVSGRPFSTDTSGTYTFTVVATDKLGKTTTRSVTYTVGPPTPLTPAQIVFTRANRIWVVGTDGSGARQLTGLTDRDPGAFLDDQAAKSPDGKKIVFARRSTASGASQLWMIDPDGRGAGPLPTSGDSTAPAWSADGTKIAFQSTGGASKNIDIWTATWNGTTLTGLTNLTNTTGNDVTPSWSPSKGTNAGKIVFASDRNQGQFEIYTMTTTGGSQTRLTNDPRTDREPAWSPDGSKITFSSDRAGTSGGFEIYVMGAPNGNSQVRLTTLGGDDGAPLWLDATRILFSSAQVGPAPVGGLAVVPAAGGAPAKLAGTLAGDANPG